jgi:hypothetical protein
MKPGFDNPQAKEYFPLTAYADFIRSNLHADT